MTRVEFLAVKIAGFLGIAVLLCCAAPTKSKVGGMGGGDQQPAVGFNPSVHCPDATLADLDKINPNVIPGLTQGIEGLPCDAQAEKNGTDLTARLQHGFDYYSWLTFIALNSPAAGTPIGKDAPTVWESYKQLPEVMLPAGMKPADWSDPNPPVVPHECLGTFKNGMTIIHLEMEETYNEPFKSGALFDQNGNYALFVISMNRQMFQYIVDHSLYSRRGQEMFPEEVDFPNGSDGSQKEHPEKTLGAVMVKASWRVLQPGIDFDPNNLKLRPKFHIIDGLLYQPEAPEPCRQVKLGLVGFHVGHKTVTRQQWIWTTFEHHDNVPTQEEVDGGLTKGRQYSFYNPDCAVSDCPINQTPPWPWQPEKLKPAAWDPIKHHSSPFRSQIVRMGPSPLFADDDVGKLNKAFHNRLRGTVWENYDLITTQWPSAPCANNPNPGSLPDATCAPFPTYLANTTLETFSQQDKDTAVPLATSSCISCHNNATTQHRPATRSDFTFILEKAK